VLERAVERHGGEVWCGADAEGGGAHVRLLLPLAEVAPGRVDGTSAVPAAAATSGRETVHGIISTATKQRRSS
jgi:hypothetical protein